MVSNTTTYQNIADILSYKTPNNLVEEQLLHPNFNWDALVIIGSKQLVIPALYCRLKSRNLLTQLPEGLELYLKDIATQNLKRNTAILHQIKTLTLLLNSHNIKHTFLKGAALLAAGYFEDLSERMIGDIDILIDLKDLQPAFKLLKASAYKPIDETFGADFFEHKHLPRLTSSSHICAVELHRKLFVTHKEKALSNSNILMHKVLKHGVSIPCYNHLLLHNILNYQINDNGQHYKTINFRSAYDTINLDRLRPPQAIETDTITTTTDKTIIAYFQYVTVFFKDLKHYGHIKKTTWFYRLKLNNTTFSVLWYKTMNLSIFLTILIHRFSYAFTHQKYRTALFKNRKQALKILKKRLL